MELILVDEAWRVNRADVRRRHVIDTARMLFVEHGFHRTGMAQIAAASGIKVGQIYRDFDGKEDIIAAICEEDVAAWLEEDVLAAAVAAEDVKAIRCWIKRFGSLESPAEECRMMTEILAEAGRNERIAEIFQTIDARIRGNLAAALAALAPAQDRSAQRTALVDLILGLGIGLMMRTIMHPEMQIEVLDRYMATIIEREIDELSR